MKLFLVLSLIILIFSCGDNSKQEMRKDSALEYVLIQFSSVDSLPENEVTIIVKDMAFSGQGPVNRYFGKISEGTISTPIGSTMMAGPEDQMQYETAFFAALDSASVSGIGSDTLRITSPDNIEMIFVLNHPEME